jgi:tetratricopeptide (TPR) repeat protein
MLAPEIYLPSRQGSLQLELLANARRRGTVPYVIRPELQALLAEVAAGHPVVVFQNLGLSWYTKWHYAVLVGFDLERDQLVLRSGTEERHQVPLAVFERTWRRGDYWAMVVMPAGQLPRTAEETPYLQAVVALERLQRWEEAGESYRAALLRWPGSLAAQLGIGNSRYALGDKRGAEQAYRAAIKAHPDSAIAFNNLAQALADQGRWQDAEGAAEQAVALGGSHLDTYQATLAEIRTKRAAGKPVR